MVVIPCKFHFIFDHSSFSELQYLIPEMMKKKAVSLFIISLLPLFLLNLHAQQGTFTKVFYDINGSAQAFVTIATSDGNFLIAGERNDQPLFMKIDEDGSIFWQKRLLLPLSRFFCAASTHDSGYFLAGRITNPEPALEDLLCVKVNSVGDTLWSRTIDFGIEDRAFGVTETTDHGVVMAGYSTPDWSSASSMMVVRLDSAGNLLWGRTFYSGNSSNVARSVCQVPDGGFIVTGSIAGASPFNEGLILMKLTPDGDLSWIKRQTFSTLDYSQGHDVKLIPGGLILLTSSTDAGIGLVKTDLSGNVIWSKGYAWSSTVYYASPAPKLGITSQGGFQFVQYFEMFGPGAAARTDSTGNLIWSSTVVLISLSALETSDGGCMITGNGPVMGVNMSPSDNPQIGIIKTDTIGNSTDCVYGGGVQENPCPISWEVPGITTSSMGTLVKIHPPVIDAIDLSVSTGCVTVVGGEAENQQQPGSLIISPNPTDGNFSVDISGHLSSGRITLEIYNSQGEKVFSSVTSMPMPVPVHVTSLPSGIYNLQLISGDKVFTKRLILIHN